MIMKVFEKIKNNKIYKKIIQILKMKYVSGLLKMVALSVAAGVLVYASYNLVDSYMNYKEDEKKYASINEMFIEDDKVDNKDKNIRYKSNTKKWVWNYKAMLKYNEESKGYIKLDGTRIQYPILEHSDNDYYLQHGSDKAPNGAGSIFIDYRSEGLQGNLCIIYGHNMMDGSMFADIMDFKKKKFCEKHKVFDIYVGYRHYKYYVYSTFSTQNTDYDVYKFGFKDKEVYAKWLKNSAQKTTYNFKNGMPNINSKVIMLSTCVNDFGKRQIVCMYRGEEVVDE